jgi:predicted secreted hydrolase
MRRRVESKSMTARLRYAAVCIGIVALFLAVGGITSSAEEDFLQVTGPCNLVFPRDHGPHPGHRTEWWYYTGNLIDAQQRHYGFQLTFFRHRLAAPHARRQWPSPTSPWRTDQIYLAHAAVTDISGGRHLQAEKVSRPALTMAGAEQKGEVWNIHINNWRTTIAPDGHLLEADAGSFALRLTLTSTKPIVLHGSNGYSRKGQTPERASCYYSFTRLRAKGTLALDAEPREVTGSAWMDHEFSTAPLEPGISGWDWFSLQLSDQTEIMFFLLRQADGRLNPASSGTYVSAQGETRHLTADQIRIDPLAHWTSPHSGARYPVRWKVSIAPLGYDMTVKANLADQEMRTPRSTRVDYWEGSVRISGTKAGDSIDGAGYVEMTGYAKTFDADL